MSELHADLLRANQHVDMFAEQAKGPELTATLRDKIAIAAMQSLLLRKDWKDHPVLNLCEAAYIYADEMLAMRETK